jgi:regulator of protease activity HflC (stomatin/prohibitin superfamily)
MKRESRAWLIGSLMVSFFIILLLAYFSSNSYTVYVHQRAVIFNKFDGGLDKETIIGPGTWYKLAWEEVYIYDVIETRMDEDLDALDKDGNAIHVKLAVGFKLVPEKFGYLHESFGKDYKEVLVIPEVRSVTRQVMGRYTAEEIYNTKRSEVEAAVKNESARVLQKHYVQLVDLLIASIELPEPLRKALEEKYRLKATKK